MLQIISWLTDPQLEVGNNRNVTQKVMRLKGQVIISQARIKLFA